jgi:redox-sensitive bicupin YhaK (pirin superfamily)
MGFGPLRVINEDYIQGGKGFAPHPHDNMEIITYVIRGALAHEDSMKHQAVIKPGEVQVMSAGSGVVHSEFNHLQGEITHLLQIWIETKSRDIKPSYDQRDFSEQLRHDGLTLVVSGDGRQGSLQINQDAQLFVGRLTDESSLDFEGDLTRRYWLQLVHGELLVDNQKLSAGDGLAVAEEDGFKIAAKSPSEFLLFDLP